jgi:hypothetical protein
LAQIVPGANLTACNVEQKEELCAQRREQDFEIGAADRRAGESFRVDGKNEVWQTR